MDTLTYIIIKEKDNYLLCYTPNINSVTKPIEKNIKKIFTTHSKENAMEVFLDYIEKVKGNNNTLLNIIMFILFPMGVIIYSLFQFLKSKHN